MKRRTYVSIIICLLLCVTLGVIFSMVATGQTNETYTKEELTTKIDETQYIKDHAHTMATSARALGWKDDDKLIKELKEKWNDAHEEQVGYQTQLDKILADEAEEAAIEAEWNIKAAEYPAATQIWRFMKNQGWNDYVCAGIMGNLMTEVGGQTLNIRYASSSNDYYGMCQWNRAYSEVWGAGLETQCNFLKDTIKYEFDTYGFKYQKEFNFDSFLNMTDAQQAALAFAKSYERCGSGSYSIRQQNAIKAYNYFVN